MDVFAFRDQLKRDYESYSTSFVEIQDERIKDLVVRERAAGAYVGEPLVQLNPSFASGGSVDDLVAQGVLHPLCSQIFRRSKDDRETPDGLPLQLHRHQRDAIERAQSGRPYVLTTGTGSGKSLSYIVPIVDRVLKAGPRQKRIHAIIVYPMNALANSQQQELRKFLVSGFGEGHEPVTFGVYTGPQDDETRKRLQEDPPDILLTNYVMLELILTRPQEVRGLVSKAQGLSFLVLDELHTYRGRQGADVALLMRRVREALKAPNLQFVGTSATMGGRGTRTEQRQRVAQVATQLFGVPVSAEDIIGETLRRTTTERNWNAPDHQAALVAAVQGDTNLPADGAAFAAHPFAAWLEDTYGIEKSAEDGAWVRVKPRSLKAGAALLEGQTKLPPEVCAAAIQRGLLAGTRASADPATGFRPFAFRLHQFISGADTVYATLENPDDRHLTLTRQLHVPEQSTRRLFPLSFCIECGTEYYSVFRYAAGEGRSVFEPRSFDQRLGTNDREPGFLFLNTRGDWPTAPESQVEIMPDGWVEEYRGGERVKSNYRDRIPRRIAVDTLGQENEDGTDLFYMPSPFAFCPCCGTTYSQVKSERTPLAVLSSEGRSTATTILTLSALRNLRTTDSLRSEARKLLSFTDNRQDASLQAGHFNDFVEVSLLRAALYRAVHQAGSGGLEDRNLTGSVFAALDLEFAEYASEPKARFTARTDTEQALRDVLGYRLYLDLRRGWRNTQPNLEQCGLLNIRYADLRALCESEEDWIPTDGRSHPLLQSATPELREVLAQTLLDLLRRELAIKVTYLDPGNQDGIRQRSNQRLRAPWAFDENEVDDLVTSRVAFPRPQAGDGTRAALFISGRGRFGRYLKSKLRPLADRALKTEDVDAAILGLFEMLRLAGLVERVAEPRDREDVPGYQLNAAAMRWCLGDGQRPAPDPLRKKLLNDQKARVNQFFVEFYREVGLTLKRMEAREHTAQVPNEEREKREIAFRSGELPVLYCSPTMELGVDINELNVVSLRNVPPTPANYAQRSGRAGRNGQQALVFTYCVQGSPHDQYFVRRPDLMVAGVVQAPRLDLLNEDLVRAHVHAVWLMASGLSLGAKLGDVIELGQGDTLPLSANVQAHLNDVNARQHALTAAARVLASVPGLEQASWYRPDWLATEIEKIPLRFEEACERWRGLFRAAVRQRQLQNAILEDYSRPQRERDMAKRLWSEAQTQIELLSGEGDRNTLSDFYSYRYFASEGFLPGYSFPRLPLSAYVPARRRGLGKGDDFLSRPRFLAISEFGPRALVYHEGAKYEINRVLLAVRPDQDLNTTQAKLCPTCGYLHPLRDGTGADVCDRCGTTLTDVLTPLLRMTNVSTRRRDRITSEEEERQRIGYEVATAYRFSDGGGAASHESAALVAKSEPLLKLDYGQAATLWRINLGWRSRKNAAQYGFLLDTERGYWARNEADDTASADDPLGPRTQRVVPYVEDRRNCLVLTPPDDFGPDALISLGYALDRAIQAVFQLEDSEIGLESLPSNEDPRQLLVYEAAEGGAGVLRRLVREPETWREVVRAALDICHFDPKAGEDKKRAEGAREDCGAACYDCLLSYGNQRNHAMLNRHSIREYLLELRSAALNVSPAAGPRSSHLEHLEVLCESELERAFLRWLDERGLRLPTTAQVTFDECGTRADFVYEDALAAVFIDGPHHDPADRQRRDKQQSDCLRDLGYTVLRFGAREDWTGTVGRYPAIFGVPKG